MKVKRAKPRRVAVLRDPAYMKWLRDTFICDVCRDLCRARGGRPIRNCGVLTEAAHTSVNGTGSKGPDSGCLPLGRGHHRELHRIGAKDFEAKYGVDLKARAAEHYAIYLKRKESQS